MNVISKIRYIRNPLKLIRRIGDRGYLNWIPDEIYLKMVYFGETGLKLNLDNPRRYNEKLQWLKLNDRRKEYNIFVDKYLVRSYISETIGEQYLIPIYGVYNTPDEIMWDKLPNKFVLKCTHGSGSNIICTNKEKLNIEEAIYNLNRWMGKSWYWFGREWPYKDINPRIICEQFLETSNGKLPTDYKVMCFNGVPKLIQVHIDRFQSTYTNDFYTVDWKKTSISQGVPNSNFEVPKPKNLELMLDISKFLSKGTFFVRIDFYELEGKLFFGEMTFYPTSGFTNFKNDEDDYKIGSWINLDN